MEMASIGFLLGAVISLAFVGIGVVIGGIDKGNTKREYRGNTISTVPVLDGNGNGSIDNGFSEQMGPEEVINVLQTIRIGASQTEKEAIDYACDRIYGYNPYQE